MNDENSSLSLATCLFFSRVTKGGKSFFLVHEKNVQKKEILLLSVRNHQNLHFNKHVCPSFVG